MNSTEDEIIEEKEFVWTTKDGRQVMPKQMDDSHLRNVIKYKIRRYLFSNILRSIKYRYKEPDKEFLYAQVESIKGIVVDVTYLPLKMEFERRGFNYQGLIKLVKADMRELIDNCLVAARLSRMDVASFIAEHGHEIFK